MFSVVDSNVYSDTHKMNTHIHSLKTQVMNTRVHSVDTWIETNVMHIHILLLHMKCRYICILSASCEQDATLCSHEYIYKWLSSGGTPYTVCFVGFDKPIMHRFEVLCPSHHEYWSSFTLCLAPHAHCATFSLPPCCVPRSHRVVKICVAPA